MKRKDLSIDNGLPSPQKYLMKEKILRLFYMVFFLSISCNSVYAQDIDQEKQGIQEVAIRPLKNGEKVPDNFWTKKHLFYLNGDTVRKSLEEYKGTLLIIDFWATWCGACRVNFPKLEGLKQKFGNEVSFILVNPTVYKNNFDQISKAYEEFKNSGGASLESVIFDEYFIDLFPHIGIPRYIWINKKGRFIASTGNLFVDEVTIKKVLDGKY